MNKVCGKCGKEHPIEHFQLRNPNTGTRRSYCRDCMKEYLKNHYKDNKRYYIDKSANNKKKYKEAYIQYKDTLVCSTCGESHISCLEFHHLDPTTKEYNISHMAGQGYTGKKLEDEIAKCIVLCSNCHRKLHYRIKFSGIV